VCREDVKEVGKWGRRDNRKATTGDRTPLAILAQPDALGRSLVNTAATDSTAAPHSAHGIVLLFARAATANEPSNERKTLSAVAQRSAVAGTGSLRYCGMRHVVAQ
jgi:hypothetical protein